MNIYKYSMLLSVSIISLTLSMNQYLSDFDVALDHYFTSQGSAQAVNHLAAAYASLTPYEQEQKQEQLLALGITLPRAHAAQTPSQPHTAVQTKTSNQYKHYTDALLQWDSRPTGSNFQLILNAIDKLEDPVEKYDATNFVQGLLHKYAQDTAEFKAADRIYAQWLQQRLITLNKNEQYLTQEQANIKEHLETCATNDPACQERKEKAQQSNAQLKKQQEELQREYQALTAQLHTAQANTQLSPETLQAENQQLTSQLAQALTEVAALEKEYEQLQAHKKPRI
ncbi:hypothetical protein H0X48_05800 [Candidatus Dependentiae bacterium]|nr:hypothetical protein [Candidatus Dependentiae bacterium]